jgi:L-asparagine transporter-like permease
MVFGQVRSLRNFAWFANLNIWINILVMVMTMVGVAKYLPVPSQSGHTDLSDPIQVTGWVPGYTAGWYAQVTGVQLAVFSYGGAMIFTGEPTPLSRRPLYFSMGPR